MINEKISVIIPFYRKVEWLREAIDSVIAQTYKNTEIIIINDGSQEEVSILLEDYKNQVIYLFQENKGAASARNLGIDVSKGEYIAFLDSDDLWLPQKLEKQLYHMKKAGAIWSHTGYSTFGEGVENKIVDMSKCEGNVFPQCIISTSIATPCVMIKSSVLKENLNLRFEVGMKSGEDLILWLKLSLKYNLLLIDEVLTKVRIRGTNSSLLAYSQIRARAQIWNKIRTNEIFNVKSELNFIVRFAFNLCASMYLFIRIFNKNDSNHNRMLEFVSKIFYIIPWIIFKSIR
jgi:glycosyltransferase involved in cell wall biosynthesis